MIGVEGELYHMGPQFAEIAKVLEAFSQPWRPLNVSQSLGNAISENTTHFRV